MPTDGPNCVRRTIVPSRPVSCSTAVEPRLCLPPLPLRFQTTYVGVHHVARRFRRERQQAEETALDRHVDAAAFDSVVAHDDCELEPEQ